jgi:release factor glutamine methyltransferase
MVPGYDFACLRMELPRMSDELSAVVATLRAAGCVFAEDEAPLLISEAGSPAELAAMVDRRVAGLPLEHILGWVEFCGLRMVVEPSVFVPRRRTEFLVRQAVSLRRANPQPPIVVDLCCGCAAIGTAVVALLGRGDLYASDIDPAALRSAQQNVLTVRGRAYVGDLYDPLPASLRGRVDLLVVNAPYVPTAAIELMPPEARLHEAPVALDGGVDGLDVQRRVIAAAGEWLVPGGRLLIETSERQAPLTVALVERAGLTAEVTGCDELDSTVVIGTRR